MEPKYKILQEIDLGSNEIEEIAKYVQMDPNKCQALLFQCVREKLIRYDKYDLAQAMSAVYRFYLLPKGKLELNIAILEQRLEAVEKMTFEQQHLINKHDNHLEIISQHIKQ